MILYGDQAEIVDAEETLDRLCHRLSRGRSADDHTAALILAGQLQQGLLDQEREDLGFDELTPLAEATTALTLCVAGRDGGWNAAAEWLRPQLSRRRIAVKTPEGYAFYGVSPEGYRCAARRLVGRIGAVIGLRSIGSSLGAAVAAGSDTRRVFSLRPVGHPFRRQVIVGDRLRAALLGIQGDFAVVDEGPGLSGSSLGAVGDLLNSLGIGLDRLIFFPSHSGDLGPEASEEHRKRWAEARKVVPSSDPDFARLASRIVGEVIAPPEDFSGGQWTKALNAVAPSFTSRERMKARLTTETGVFLVKFAGLGQIGEGKLSLARELYLNGFCPEPLGLESGYLIRRWVEGRVGVESVARDHLISRLGAYIAYRAIHFPAPPGSGATLESLLEMARLNLAEGGCGAASQSLDRTDRKLLSREVRRVRIDGRLHPWEWVTDRYGTLIKTDAVDHHAAHDLIGCQDPAWDLAGAAVEFDLDPDERKTLLRAYGADVDDDLLALHRILYVGFQIGQWSMARSEAAGDALTAIEGLLAKYRAAL